MDRFLVQRMAVLHLFRSRNCANPSMLQIVHSLKSWQMVGSDTTPVLMLLRGLRKRTTEIIKRNSAPCPERAKTRGASLWYCARTVGSCISDTVDRCLKDVSYLLHEGGWSPSGRHFATTLLAIVCGDGYIGTSMTAAKRRRPHGISLEGEVPGFSTSTTISTICFRRVLISLAMSRCICVG